MKLITSMNQSTLNRKLDVMPQKYPRIFIIKIIIYFGYNWVNLGIFLGIFR